MHADSSAAGSRTGIEGLALFGAPPAFPDPLHVGRPNVGDRARFYARLDDILDRRWLTNHGRYVLELEQRLCELTGAAHCIAMCNATVALEIAIRALEMRGEVIVPAFTFVATAHALQWQEITPVFCDVDPETHCLDSGAVERMLTPRTTGIIGVHLWGRACEVERLEEIAARRGLALLYDAAHALGCTHGGRPIGNFGRAEVFSFHATKFVNSFEGGAVVTNDGELARKIRLMQNFGFSGLDNVIYLGTNGKMSEVSAAMGLTGLESMDEFIEVNRRNYRLYGEGLSGLSGLTLLPYDPLERSNYQYVVLQVDPERAGLSRDGLMRVLHAEGVLVRRYFFPGVHRMEPYRSYFPHAGLLLPVTESLCRRVLLLPTGTAVGPEEIAAVCRIVRTALELGPELERRLGSDPA